MAISAQQFIVKSKAIGLECLDVSKHGKRII